MTTEEKKPVYDVTISFCGGEKIQFKAADILQLSVEGGVFVLEDGSKRYISGRTYNYMDVQEGDKRS